MRIFQFPLVRLFSAYVLGILIAFYQDFSIANPSILIGCLLILLLNIFSVKAWASLSFYLFFFLLGSYFLNNRLQKAPLNSPIDCLCNVSKVNDRYKRLSYWMTCQSARGLTFNTEVKWFDPIKKPVLGEKLRIKLTLLALPSNAKNNGFDYNTYLKKNGIQTYSKIKNVKKSGYTSISIPNPIQTHWRKIWINLLRSKLSQEAATLVPAILFGDKSQLNKDTKQLFSQAGIIHILAVSGLHVGMLYLLVYRALFWIGHRPKRLHIRNAIALIILILYAWICGFSPSISRAVLMFAMVFTSRLFLKNSPTLHQLIVSAFILLIIEPLWLFQLGFQFSYLATAGIIIGLQGSKNLKSNSKLLTFILESTVVSFSAQGAVTPISLYYFKQVPIWFFLTNIPAFLLAFLLLLCSLLFLLFSSFPYIRDLLIYPIEWCTIGLFGLIELINLFPIRMVNIAIQSVAQVLYAYFTLYSLFLFISEKEFGLLKWILLSSLCMLIFN